MHIAIAGSAYNTNSKAFEIYVSGCTHNCPSCHNSELQAFSVGKSWIKWYRLNKHKFKNPLVERIWILGGDLMCQEEPAYLDMVNNLKATGLELWLWTGKELEEIPKVYEVMKYFDYIKTGRYLKDRPKKEVSIKDFTLTLVSDNQKLYDVKRECYV